MLALARDPLHDITALADPALVIIDGRALASQPMPASRNTSRVRLPSSVRVSE